VEVLEDDCLRIAGLADAALRDKMKTYRDLLAARAERLKGGARRYLPDSFWDEGAWGRMTRQEMESALILEAFKAHLGKATEEESRRLALLPSAQAPRQGGYRRPGDDGGGDGLRPRDSGR
jgi:hypothetical protein